MTLKRVLLVILLCLLAIVGLPGAMLKPALACGGGGSSPSFFDAHRSNDITVKATVVEPDDLGQNAIVKVERYYKGGAGPAYILFSRNEIATIYRLIDGRHNDDCKSLKPTLQRGDTLYFTAHRTYAGAYYSSDVFMQEYLIFRTPTDKVEIEDGDAPEPLTAAQFEELLEKKLGHEFNVPNPKLSYSRYAPLFIATKDGKRYLLPVDSDTLLDIDAFIANPPERRYGPILEKLAWLGRVKDRCVGKNCMAYYPLDDDEYDAVLDYCHKNKTYQAAVISPIGGFAVWADGKLFFGCKDYAVDYLATDSKNTAEALAIYAQWSSDGQKFTYNDLKGLWLWDGGSSPRLIIPSIAGFALPRYFSPHANYLAITLDKKPYTLNLQTGKLFPDGIFSSTEKLFIAFGTVDPKTGTFPIEICDFGYRANFINCNEDELVGSDGSDIKGSESYFSHVKQVAWADQVSLRLLILPYPEFNQDEENFSLEKYWDTKRGFVLQDYVLNNNSGYLYPKYEAYLQPDKTYKPAREVISGVEFVYDHYNKNLALRQNDTTIFIDNKSYDFSKQLSSPIVQIDWLPSLMYRDRAR